MKALVTTLSIVGLGLAAVFCMLYNREHSRAEASAEDRTSLSNQVAELRTRLALEHGTSAMARSNLQHVVDRRTVELFATSNRLVQFSLLYSNAQHEVRAAEAEHQSRTAALAALQAQLDEQRLRLETISPLQSELAATKRMLTQSRIEYEDLAQALGRLRVEKADLEQKFDDPAFLRLEIKKAEDRAALRKRMAAGRRLNESDRRVQLELQADGTVRPVSLP